MSDAVTSLTGDLLQKTGNAFIHYMQLVAGVFFIAVYTALAMLLDWWLALLGAGLGVFYEPEKAAEPREQEALQVHNTLLWILAEFGLVGGCARCAVSVGRVVPVARMAAIARCRSAGLVLGGLMPLGAWATMSMAHGLLYQRVPWFALAICLGGATRYKAPHLRRNADSL